MNNKILEQLKIYETEFKTFMGIKDFPLYSLQTKISTIEVANRQGFEVAASTHYQVGTRKHSLTISENLVLAKYLVYHEFTHMLDSEMHVNGDKVRYMGISGYTEYHASQIELLQLLGAKNCSDNISFSMNNTIETFSDCKSVQQYINEKQQHAIELFSRKDFPNDINTLKSAVGILFNYFGLRSICEMYAIDYNENINNQAYLKFIPTQQFTIINNLMHGWLDSAKIELSIIFYNGMMMSLIKENKLI